MDGSRDLWQRAKQFNCSIFPLGAGGGVQSFYFHQIKNLWIICVMILKITTMKYLHK